MGALMRCGLYTFMMALLPRGQSVPALFARSGSPSMLTTTPSFMVATKLQLPHSMHMRQWPYTSPVSPCAAALGAFANAFTGLYVNELPKAAAAPRAPAPFSRVRLVTFIVFRFIV